MTGKAEGMFFDYGGELLPVMGCFSIGETKDGPLFSIFVLMPDGMVNITPIICGRSDLEYRKLN